MLEAFKVVSENVLKMDEINKKKTMDNRQDVGFDWRERKGI